MLPVSPRLLSPMELLPLESSSALLVCIEAVLDRAAAVESGAWAEQFLSALSQYTQWEEKKRGEGISPERLWRLMEGGWQCKAGRYYKEQNSQMEIFPCHRWLEIKYTVFGLNSTAFSNGVYAINHPWKVLLTGVEIRLNKTLLCTARYNFFIGRGIH